MREITTQKFALGPLGPNQDIYLTTSKSVTKINPNSHQVFKISNVSSSGTQSFQSSPKCWIYILIAANSWRIPKRSSRQSCPSTNWKGKEKEKERPRRDKSLKKESKFSQGRKDIGPPTT
ncbi:hypothetical protein CR513_36019, partial [Mucuna pruriens]